MATNEDTLKRGLPEHGRSDIEAKPNGRKWNRNTIYQPEFCERVIELMTQGMSLRECAVDLGVTSKTLIKWREQFPEFDEAMEHAFERAQAYYEKIARDCILIETFEKGHQIKYSEGTLRFIMSTRFGVRESKVVEISDTKEKEGIELVGMIKEMHEGTI